MCEQLPNLDEMAATILRVTRFPGFRAERLFLAETDGVEALVGNTEADEVLLDGIGTAIAEGELVFGGTTFVAVPLDGDVHLGTTSEEVGSPAESLASYTVNFGGVVVEIGVAHFLEKKLIERDVFGVSLTGGALTEIRNRVSVFPPAPLAVSV